MINTTTLDVPKIMSMSQKAARSLVFRCLNMMSVGRLELLENFDTSAPMRTHHFGCSDSNNESITATVEIRDPQFYSRIIKGGSIAAGESYMDGWWDSPDLTALMHLMASNLSAIDNLEKRGSLLTHFIEKIKHWGNRNTKIKAMQNIAAHYDIGNDLYHCFLDRQMLYSSAVFQNEEDTLEQAQYNKMERLCQQLELQQDDHVIEIGTGWGAMAIHMAEHYGCHVTTTTISEEQFQYAKQKIEQKGLTNKIRLIKKDYRDLNGQYDKLVSIEMIEAVGKAYLPSYIKQCYALLKPNGKMVIQAITIADQRYEHYSNCVDFIQKYIFPGGFLPSISALTQATTQYSGFVLRDLKDIGMDYALTLREWQHRFNAEEAKVRALGYDDRFIRMWRYYLSYCEGGFLAKTISTVHLTFSRS